MDWKNDEKCTFRDESVRRSNRRTKPSVLYQSSIRINDQFETRKRNVGNFFKCPDKSCDLKYRLAISARYHYESVHRRLRFACKKCERSYTRRRALVTHNCKAKRKKSCLDLFETLAESSQSRVTEHRAKGISSSQACSSRSSGSQIEELRHHNRSRSIAGPPANEEFRFWDMKPKTQTPILLKKCISMSTATLPMAKIPMEVDKKASSVIRPISIKKSSSSWVIAKDTYTKARTETIVEKTIDITINDNTELRQSLIKRIEDITLVIVEQMCNGQVPSISYKLSTIETLMDQRESQNSVGVSVEDVPATIPLGIEATSVFDTPESMDTQSIEIEVDESLPDTSERRRVVNFGHDRSQSKFALLMTTMAKVHELLSSDRTQTRRSFFYELKGDETASKIVTEQRQVDQIVNELACLLECPPWEMGLVASAKGLAAGDMTLKLSNGREINFTNPDGALIPQNVSNVISIRTRAKVVIVVEKDTIFQKLLTEDCVSRLNCILITGKGYPDVATRMLVKLLAEKVNHPVYILVDADPHGMEIMCTYKYGSINLSHQQGSLTSPSIRWLGLHPSDLSSLLKIPTIPLTDNDISKIKSLQSRPYVDERLSKELEIMRKGKAEIEAIFSDSQDSCPTSLYVEMKIESGEYI